MYDASATNKGIFEMRLPVSLLAVCLAQSVHATIFTVEPDDFAPDTNLTNAIPGIHLSTLAGNDVYAKSTCVGAVSLCRVAPTGSLTFGNETNTAWYFSPAPGVGIDRLSPDMAGEGFADATLLISFDNPTNSIGLLATIAYDAGGVTLLAYDSAGNLLRNTSLTRSTQTVYPFPEERGQSIGDFTLTSLQNDIAFLVVGGNDGGVRLDHLKFSAVPEPGPLALLLTGLLGVGAMRRGRKHR